MAKVLVIDDDELVCVTIGDMLENGGHVPVLASGGRDGVARFKAEEPALIITDLVMPEQDGLETMRQIRQLRSDAKVICVSGYGHDLPMATKLGAAATLKKPFDSDALLDLVARVLCANKGHSAR
jgi:DNA-binding NtrC family response regulator